MTTEPRRTHANRNAVVRTVRRTAVALFGVAITIGGCALEPQMPAPISRLPADQSGVPASPHPLTPEERARYEAIDRQVLAEQDRAMALDATTAALSRAYGPPVTLYGGYFGGWRGPAWSVGFGNAGWGSPWGPGWGRPGWGVGSGFSGWGWGGGMGWGMGWGW
jgi:hypothetical protein